MREPTRLGGGMGRVEGAGGEQYWCWGPDPALSAAANGRGAHGTAARGRRTSPGGASRGMDGKPRWGASGRHHRRPPPAPGGGWLPAWREPEPPSPVPFPEPPALDPSCMLASPPHVPLEMGRSAAVNTAGSEHRRSSPHVCLDADAGGGGNTQATAGMGSGNIPSRLHERLSGWEALGHRGLSQAGAGARGAAAGAGCAERHD